MSAHTAEVSTETPSWSGGTSPYNVSYGKLMMWFFLVSDAFSFSGLLIAYGFQRFNHAAEWAVPDKVFKSFPFLEGEYPMAYVGLMTFILIMSSVTMVLAVEAGHRNDKQDVIKWMALTIVGGFTFLGSQAYEWYHFIHGTEMGAIIDGTLFHGASLEHNEYGHKLFGSFFFFITGFHGFHVFSGVIINIIIFINVLLGTYERRGHYEMVEKVGLYWHFVDLVWVFVFTFFYLL